MIVYPSNTLHRVAPVDKGERLAAVGWARSFVRSPERREILFDLETARREIFDLHGKSSTFDQLSKCSANLLRMWGRRLIRFDARSADRNQLFCSLEDRFGVM